MRETSDRNGSDGAGGRMAIGGGTAFRAVAAAILVAEYIAIAMVFDIKPALDRGGDWSDLAGLRDLGMVAAATLVALFAIGYQPHGTSEQRWTKQQTRGLCVAHVALLGAFCGLTWFVLSRGPAPPGPPWPWLGTWAGSGLLSTLVFLGAVLGPSLFSWRALALGAGAAAAGTTTVLIGKALQTQHDWMSRSVVTLAGALLQFGFSDVIASPDTKILGAQDFRVFIADECSGLEGLGLAAVLLPLYLVAFRKHLRFPNALWLLPAGLLAVWIGNIFRIAALVWVGVVYDPELAVGGFHSKIGWTFFCAIVLSVSALGGRLSFFSSTATERPQLLRENPTAAFLLPLMALIAAAQLTGLFTNARDPLYWVRIAAASAVVYVYREAYRGLGWRPTRWSVVGGVGIAVPWLLLNPDASGAAPPTEEMGLFWLAVRAAGSTVVVPVVEELAFRGFLLRRLQGANFWSISIRAWTPKALILSSLLFGLLHERWVAGSLAGLVYAAVQLRSGRFGDAVAAHALTNGLIALWTLSTGDWSHW